MLIIKHLNAAVCSAVRLPDPSTTVKNSCKNDAQVDRMSACPVLTCDVYAADGYNKKYPLVDRRAVGLSITFVS